MGRKSCSEILTGSSANHIGEARPIVGKSTLASASANFRLPEPPRAVERLLVSWRAVPAEQLQRSARQPIPFLSGPNQNNHFHLPQGGIAVAFARSDFIIFANQHHQGVLDPLPCPWQHGTSCRNVEPTSKTASESDPAHRL